jgi:hypothetical protein
MSMLITLMFIYATYPETNFILKYKNKTNKEVCYGCENKIVM